MLHTNIVKFLVEYVQTGSTDQKKASIRRLKTIIRKCADCTFDPHTAEDCYPRIIGTRDTPSHDLMLFLCQSYWSCKQRYTSDKVREWIQGELGLGRMSRTIDLCF